MALFLWAAFFILPAPVQGSETAPSREESQFKIYIAGKEVGKEKFAILASSEGVVSSSILEFKEPGEKSRKVKMETRLKADSLFSPQTYSLKTDIGGQKGAIAGTFSPGEAMFEIQGGGGRRGILVGERCMILDSNIFHHFIFIVRAFDFGGKKLQLYEAVVPQELDGGVLRVGDLGTDRIFIRGKGMDLNHLRVDSGRLIIDLWSDSRRILHKISIPAKRVEVIRAD